MNSLFGTQLNLDSKVTFYAEAYSSKETMSLCEEVEDKRLCWEENNLHKSSSVRDLKPNSNKSKRKNVLT